MWYWPIRKHITGFEFHLRSLPCAFNRWSVNQLVSLLLAAATPCWRDPTGSKPSTVAILGFQFGLYHVVVPLNFLRSNWPASRVTLEYKRARRGCEREIERRSRETRKFTFTFFRLFTRLLPAWSLCSSPLARVTRRWACSRLRSNQPRFIVIIRIYVGYWPRVRSWWLGIGQVLFQANIQPFWPNKLGQ